MGNDILGRCEGRWGAGGLGKDVISIINTCSFVYCSLLGILCTGNIIRKNDNDNQFV